MQLLPAICGSVLLLCVSLGVARAEDADLTTPEAAARTLLLALDRGDAETARSAVIDEKDAHATVDASAELSRAMKNLAAVVERTFNEPGTKITGPLDRISAQVEHLKTVKATIEGDRATVPMDGEKPLQLRKIDGQWKVDLNAMATGQMPNAIQVMRALAKVTGEMSADIEAKKFNSLEEAQAAYYGRVARAMEGLASLGAPSTQPTEE
jgi:hypothetical protein